MIPTIRIPKDSRVLKYLIYRSNDINKLPNNISFYKGVKPDIKVENISLTTDLYVQDCTDVIEENVTKYTAPNLTNKALVRYEIEYQDSSSPKIKFTTEVIDEYLNLNYRTIGINGSNISELSDVASTKTKIQYNNVKNQVYIYDNLILDNINFFEEGIIDTKTLYVVKDPVKQLSEDDISYNLKYLNSQSINLEINNIWKDEKYILRQLNDIKIISKYRSSKVLNDTISNIVNIKIDKMLILRKDDDGTNEHISEEDLNAKKKLLIRATGIYDNYDNSIDLINNGICEKDLYLVIDNMAVDKFRLCDKGILKKKKYKYSIIIFDAIGQKSEPYTFKVST